MTFSTKNFHLLTPLAPKFPNFATQILLFRLKHTVCRRHTCRCATKFLHHMGTGCCLPKTMFKTKIGGGLGQGSIQNIWDPYVFLKQLKLSTSNLVHNLVLGLAYQKTTFWTKIGGVWARGVSEKNWDSLHILQPLKIATSNLVHNFGLGLPYQKTTFRTKIGGGMGQGSIRKNLGPPIYFCNRLKIGTQQVYLPKHKFQDQTRQGPKTCVQIGRAHV